jgi:hypothetical protein
MAHTGSNLIPGPQVGHYEGLKHGTVIERQLQPYKRNGRGTREVGFCTSNQPPRGR